MSSDWHDELDEDEWSDGAWEDEDGESLTVTCPECGADVYEDAEQCPVCGAWIVPSNSPMAGRPTWFVLLGLLGIVAVVIALSGLAAFL